MEPPPRFQPTDTLQTIGPKLNRLVEFVRSLVPRGDGRSIRVTTTPGGSFFAGIAEPGGGASEAASGGSAPVQLTAKTDDHTYTGNVYKGRHNTATETAVTIKVGAIASGETLPTSGDYAWFVAHKETWDVAGTDTELWTIQPEIYR